MFTIFVKAIGIGAAVRRLAGRVLMKDKGEDMGKVFTTTKPDAALLREAAAFKNNKLSAAEYDGETTWSARTRMTFALQRISVAIHKAVAKELSDALGFSAAVDPRGAPRD